MYNIADQDKRLCAGRAVVVVVVVLMINLLRGFRVGAHGGGRPRRS
jgi:hypothetical protein